MTEPASGTSLASPRARSSAAAAPAWTVFLVALCLRPAITVVGPLLPSIKSATHLGDGRLGILGAVPLLAFAAVSPLVPKLSRRLGPERCVLAALLLLAAGCAVRSYAGTGGLWLGTLVVGTAIAVGNVLVPVLVKRDFAASLPRATSTYIACMTGNAALAAAVAVPLATATDWRLALAIWGAGAALVALFWWPRARTAAIAAGRGGEAGHDRHPSVWRQPTAWLVTAFMGLQSTAFYVCITWLPTIEISKGVAAREAGVHLFVLQITGLAGTLGIPLLLRRNAGSQVASAVVATVPMLVAALGLLAAPGLVLAWVVLAGLGQGCALVVALSLIGLRGRTPHETTQLSGMAQSLGYLLAAAGPVAAGALAERTGSWNAALILLAGLGVVQLAVAVGAGRDRRAVQRAA